MDVVERFVPGEIALQRGDWDGAITHLERAVEAEDLLGFGGEPPAYLQPIRHTLGAVYMKAGRFADAERVYREDLREYAGNGWSLYGLARALEAQSKADEANRRRGQVPDGLAARGRGAHDQLQVHRGHRRRWVTATDPRLLPRGSGHEQRTSFGESSLGAKQP